MQLSGKVAIITGAACGIGRTTAETFVREGAAVLLADVNENAGKALADSITAAGGKAIFEKVDVTDTADVNRMIASAQAAFGKIDILVNNAGITADARLVKMDLEQWQSVIDVNLKGVFLCGQAAANVMVEQGHGGVILNASSVVGLYGNFGQSNYVATKAGVVGMTKTWAKELGRAGIRVNAVAPGFIATDMINTIPEKVIQMMIDKTALGRKGRPEDIANAYLFLASDASLFITGTVISVDGGISF